MNILTYKIKESKLKGMGYTFQKLYARNYKTYRKIVGDNTLWLWSKGKTIELDDLYHLTGEVINFVKENINNYFYQEKEYIKISINTSTNEIKIVPLLQKVFKDNPLISKEEQWSLFEHQLNEEQEIKYKVFYKKSFQEVLQEIEKLI